MPRSRTALVQTAAAQRGRWALRLALAIGLMAASGPAAAERLRFVALGDTSYQLPRDSGRYEALVEAINREQPAFSIHVGDFKGYSSCADDQLRAVAGFHRFAEAVFLTPGDNEWADCDGDEAGRFQPLERLEALRRLFFAGDRSLGARPLPLTRQAGFPENARWVQSGVVFATVHATGPNNGLLVDDEAMARNSLARVAAGKAWLTAAFADARARGAPGLVIAFHADPWLTSGAVYEFGPLDWIRQIVRAEAATFAGQILLVHGDSHRLTIDQPFRRPDIERGVTSGMNVTRLMVPGWPDHRAVVVDVDTAAPGLFSFRPIFSADEAGGARP